MERNVSGDIFHNQLLALATSAKGDEPMDPTVKPMSEEDREWLKKVLQEYASDSDPVKQLKNILSKLEALASSSSDSTDNSATASNSADNQTSTTAGKALELQIIVDEELIDLVCDMDLALDFCKLGGLQIIRRFLTNSPTAQTDAMLLGVVAEISQNNLAVQEFIVKDEFLIPYCIAILDRAVAENTIAGDDEAELLRCLKAVGALSAIIRGYIPAAGKFARLNGPQKFVGFFEYALQNANEKLVNRCTFAARGIAHSFKPELSSAMKVSGMLGDIREKLEASDPEKYEESRELLRPE